MYRFAICDDDINCAKTLCKVLESEFISQNFDAEVITATSNQEEVYELIQQHKIDILFLDIEFKNKGKNGIDFANDLRDLDNDFYLIFLSAHIKYMPLSFSRKTFDFLIKPVHKSVITLLVERLKKELEKNSSTFLTVNKNLTIKIETITFIEKEKYKCKIHTTVGVFFGTITLDQLTTILPRQFGRCHRSIIYNSDRVSIYNAKKNIIIFDNGDTCPCSYNFEFGKEEKF